MRLDQLLAANHISRKKMKQSLLQKQILVDGKPAYKLSQNVDTGLQQITFQGKHVSGPAHRYYMLNKPSGAVTANRDAEKLTVLDLLDKEIEKENLYSIGRLDRDTEGLLLITDNGPLGFQLLHPQYHVEKTYYVEVNGPLTPQDKIAFQEGIRFLDGTVCQPAQLSILSTSSSLSRATVKISEGKFHQIKKMFLAIGVKVTYLKRIQFGDFTLDPDLATGDYRPLNQEELGIIKKYLGTLGFMLALLSIIVVIIDVQSKAPRIEGNGFTVGYFLIHFYPFWVVYLVITFMSILVFVSIIFFTSQMANNTEIVAVLSSGASFHRFSRPYFYVGIFLMLLTLATNHFILPWANGKKNELIIYTYNSSNRNKYIDITTISAQLSQTEYVFINSYHQLNQRGSGYKYQKFDKKGNWKEIDCKYSRVPSDLVPTPILRHISSQYPDLYIVQIDRDSREYEVELNNGLELVFSLKGVFKRFHD